MEKISAKSTYIVLSMTIHIKTAQNDAFAE